MNRGLLVKSVRDAGGVTVLLAAALLLAYEHSLISPTDLSKLGAAFFTMNGIIAIVFGTIVAIGTVLD